MNAPPHQAEPLFRSIRARRQDTAILVTLFAFAIAITPEFSFLGVPKVRVTDLLLFPLLAYIAPASRGQKRKLPLLTIFSLVILWDLFVLLLFGQPDSFKMGLLFIGKRLSYYLIFLVGYSAVHSRAVWERTIGGLLMATPILALSILWAVRSEADSGEAQRASGIIANQQTSTALFFVVLLTLCLGALPVWRSPFSKLVGIASLGTGLPAMLATGTRGALIDIAFAVGVLEVLRRDLARSIGAVVLGAVLLAVAWNFIPGSLQDRLAETVPSLLKTWENRSRATELMGSNSAAARVAMAQACFRDSISKSPLVGSGMASRKLGFVDNFFLTEWTFNGLIGLVLMLIFLFRIGGLLWRAYRTSVDPLEKGIAAGVFASFMALWMATLHSDSFYLIRPMEAFMLLAGLVVGCSRLDSKGIPESKRKKQRRTFQQILDE